jgi:hypothetical protein
MGRSTFFAPLIAADLKGICKLVHLEHGSAMLISPSTARTAEVVSQAQSSRVQSAWEAQVSRSCRSLQILIVDDYSSFVVVQIVPLMRLPFRFQIVEGGIAASLHFPSEFSPVRSNLRCREHLRFQTEDADHTALS